MRIAVTGASGFLGSHVVKEAASRGWQVVPIVRTIDERSGPGAVTAESLRKDPSILKGVDALVHTAAIRHRYGTPKEAYASANVDFVSDLLELASGRVGRFVHISSVGVYGFPARVPISEAHAFSPATDYSESKVVAESLVRRECDRRKLEYTIVRPTIVYGQGDTNGMLDKMARMIKARSYVLVGDGTNVLHHTYIDDMVSGILLAATHPKAKSEDFILCGPETITLRELSLLVAKTLNTRLLPVHVPLRFARAVASVVDWQSSSGRLFATREPPINHEKLDVMTKPICFDCGKAKVLLGFEPKVAYKVGVAKTLGTG